MEDQMSSTDLNAKNAISKITSLNSIEEIFTFVSGDDKKSVQEAATAQISILTTKAAPPSPADQKQGEVKNMSETSQEFKAATVVHKSSVITMRNGEPTTVYFDDRGKEIITK